MQCISVTDNDYDLESGHECAPGMMNSDVRQDRIPRVVVGGIHLRVNTTGEYKDPFPFLSYGLNCRICILKNSIVLRKKKALNNPQNIDNLLKKNKSVNLISVISNILDVFEYHIR